MHLGQSPWSANLKRGLFSPIFINIYFIWLHQTLVVAHRIFIMARKISLPDW